MFHVQRLGGLVFWLALVFIVLFAAGALAHDSWISRGALKNPAGEWCCGAGDCGVMVKGGATPVSGGYQVDATFRILDGETAREVRVREFWPYRETLPSPDGAFWRCERPDGSRRCAFAPPPGS